MSYQINFDQISNSAAWREDILLIAADDLTPLVATGGFKVTMQMWARRSRGFADQSQWYTTLPIGSNEFIQSTPVISASTDDGTGILTFIDGVLGINIPASIMDRLRDGFYEIGCRMADADTSEQLFVGIVPIISGMVL